MNKLQELVTKLEAIHCDSITFVYQYVPFILTRDEFNTLLRALQDYNFYNKKELRRAIRRKAISKVFHNI